MESEQKPKKAARKQVSSKSLTEPTEAVPAPEERGDNPIIDESEEESVETIPIKWYTASELEEVHQRIFDWLANHKVGSCDFHW
jgi:hypothetical protein